MSASDRVTVSYTADWWDSIHSFGHLCCGYLYAANFTDHPVTNVMEDGRAPTFSASAVEGAGQMLSGRQVDEAVLTLTFDEQLDPNAEPAPGAFSVTVNGDPVSFRAYSRARGGRPLPVLWDPIPVWINGRSVMLTLAGNVRARDEVAVRYEPPGSGAKLQDLAGNPVASFAATKVENLTHYKSDEQLIADAKFYAQQTQHGYDHVLRWVRVLKTLGVLEDMTAAEAQGYADAGQQLWAPVAAELRQLEAAAGHYEPDQELVGDVWGYSRQTYLGPPHVLLCMRTLKTLGALEDMTADEAQDYADQYLADRWDPVVAKLAAREAATSEPEASVPGAPANFAVRSTAGSLDIPATWDALDGATSYRLAWRQADGEFEAANAITVTETSATITVSGYGEWEVQLEACNDGGCGPSVARTVGVAAAEPQSAAQGYRGQLGEVLRELSLRRPAQTRNDGVSAQSTHSTSIVYVIDDSGSMDGDFPEVRDALEGVRGETMANTKVALIAFGTDNGDGLRTYGPLVRRDDRALEHAHINSFGGKLGGTFYRAPLQNAKALLDDDDDATTKKIIFLTDSQAPRPEAVVQAINDANIVVDTIGFGDHFSDNFDVIERIATGSSDGQGNVGRVPSGAQTVAGHHQHPGSDRDGAVGHPYGQGGRQHGDFVPGGPFILSVPGE